MKIFFIIITMILLQACSDKSDSKTPVPPIVEKGLAPKINHFSIQPIENENDKILLSVNTLDADSDIESINWWASPSDIILTTLDEPNSVVIENLSSSGNEPISIQIDILDLQNNQTSAVIELPKKVFTQPVLTVSYDNSVDEFSVFQNSIEIAHSSLEIGQQPVSISASKDLNCLLNGMPFQHDENSNLIIELAYQHEKFDIECSINLVGSNYKLMLPLSTLTLNARDPQLENALIAYLNSHIRKAEPDTSIDPYAGFRTDNYYNEIHRFIMASEIYLEPKLFNLAEESQTVIDIENYLINTAESYFEPCYDYDFDNGNPRQCRSPQRRGDYYLWRSGYNMEARLKYYHPKMEWRAGAGISQVIKTILRKNFDSSDVPTCRYSELPSSVKNQSLTCRALNLRKLMYNEVWLKWNDAGFAGTSTKSIGGTDVSHYIAWLELIVDMFEETNNLYSQYIGVLPVKSRMDDLINNFTFEFGDGYTSITCTSLPFTRACSFGVHDLNLSNAIDLSHISSFVHHISRDGKSEICTTDNTKCLSVESIVKTFNEKAWAPRTKLHTKELGFPKFDMFVNGYCVEAVKSNESALYDTCQYYWVTNTAWPAHRELFGFVNLGRYNRDLMIKLRKAVDQNQDGELNAHDTFLHFFSVSLYAAQKRGKL